MRKECGGKWGGGILIPSRGAWGSVVSSPSGVRGNAFLAYLMSTEHFWYTENSVIY